MKLADHDLLRERCFIDGQWAVADGGQALTVNNAAIGGELTASPVVRKLSFTGSTPIGIQLLQQSAATVKKVTLELGGNAPFIVFDDADLDAAVEGALIAKFRNSGNSGQTCVCANRFYIQDGIYERFIEAFARRVSELVVGDGSQAGTTVGPLIDARAVAGVDAMVREALEGGARVLVGGKRHDAGEGATSRPCWLMSARTCVWPARKFSARWRRCSDLPAKRK